MQFDSQHPLLSRVLSGQTPVGALFQGQKTPGYLNDLVGGSGPAPTFGPIPNADITRPPSVTPLSDSSDLIARNLQTVLGLASGSVNSGSAVGLPGGASPRVRQELGFAQRQVGDRYVTGATGPSAYDCSGLLYAALRKAGINVPRLTARGYQSLFPGVGRNQLQPGDPVYFWYPNSRGIPQGQASHVGIFTGNGQMVAAANSREGVVSQPVDWSHFIGGSRVKRLHR